MASMTTEFAAKDTNFSSTTQRLQKSLAGFEGSLDRFNASAANIGTSFTKLGAGLVAGVAAFVGIRSAAEGVKKAFDEAAESQQFERRFETLLGSADAARKRMQELEQFMDSTPFQLPGIVQASQTLETLTGSALSTGEGLRMVGDAASGTGKPIEEMAVTLGRLYNGLSAGGVAIGDQTKRLVDLGVITPQVGQELSELAKEGVGSARAFELIEDATSKFSGEMQRQSTTWNATLEGLGDAINKALRNFATPLIEVLTPQIQKVADFVRGTLAPAIENAMSKFTSDWLPAFFDAAQTATDYLRGALSLSPGEMFKLMISNMLDFQRIAADTLISAFATSVNFLGNFMGKLFTNHVPQLIGETLGHAFAHDVAKLASALFKVFAEAAKHFGTLWQSVTQMSASELLKKLMQVVQSFATGWGRAMIDPIGFLTQKVGEGLAEAFADSAHEFMFQFDNATGSWIEKTDKALENTALAAGEKFGEAGSKLGDALVKSTEEAVRDTEIVRVNLFGSAEAAERIKNRTAEMAEHGKQFRTDIEAAAFDAEKLAKALREARVERFTGDSPDSPFPANTRGGGAKMPPSIPEPPPEGEPAGDGGGASPRGSSGNSMREPASEGNVNARAETFRNEAEQRRYEERINRMTDAGQFRSAAQAMGRADRAAARREDSFRGLQNIRDQGMGQNMGEAFNNFRRQFGMDAGELIKSRLGDAFDPTQSMQANFEKMAQLYQKPEFERKNESADNRIKQQFDRPSGDGGGSLGLALESTLQQLVTEIKTRLPQHALS